MIEILVTMFIVTLIWFVGVIYGWNAHKSVVERRIKDFSEHIIEHISKDVIEISIERHDGVMYVYDLETQAFMAQGKNARELETVLREKFPRKTFAASTKDIKESGLRNESI